MSSRLSRSKSSRTKKVTTSAKEIDVYREFVRWTSKRSPKWHPVKKMRYIFWRMMSGKTVTDALREIRWTAREYWHHVDENFIEEYKVAQRLQSRAMADSLITISEGRDWVTRSAKKRMDRVIARAVKKLSRKKTSIEKKMILSQLMGDLREHDKIVMTRNKMQMDAAKWHAGKANPNEFGEKSSLALGGFNPIGDGNPAKDISVVFIAPDGTEVPFDPKTGGS